MMTNMQKSRVLGFTCLLCGAWLLLTAGTAQADYMSTVLADNPVAYWRLNETGEDGTTLYDSGSNGLNGVWHNTSSYASLAGYDGPQADDYPGFGTSNVAPKFYSSNNSSLSYVSVADCATLDGLTGALTLEFWVYNITSNKVVGLINKTGYNSNDELQRTFRAVKYNDGGTLQFYISDDGSSSYASLDSTSKLAYNTWSHVAMTFVPGESLNIYINGVLDATTSTTISSIATNDCDLWFGTQLKLDNYTRFFKGGLDEVAIYDTALTAGQVAAHYAAATTIPEPSTLALLSASLIGLLAYAWRKRK